MNDLFWIVEPLLAWYNKSARTLPWRENRNPYRIWVSEIMLQQTRVEAAIPYYERFMEQLPTIQSLAQAEEETVLKLWEGLGYYSRARNLRKAAQTICTEYEGIFPKKYEDILSLSGIGKYTAGAISSIAHGLPRAAVDGNVLRVITRITENDTDIGNEKFRNQMAKQLEEIYPEDACSEFTQSLMELGAMICVPNGAPKCEECPLNHGCLAYLHHTQEQYPVKKEKAKRKQVNKTVFLLTCEDKIAIQKREDAGLLAGMWEFPNIDEKMNRQQINNWLAEHNVIAKSIKKGNVQNHIFTHIEWKMQCYEIACEQRGDEFIWAEETELEEKYALPTAFRKCIN